MSLLCNIIKCLGRVWWHIWPVLTTQYFQNGGKCDPGVIFVFFPNFSRTVTLKICLTVLHSSVQHRGENNVMCSLILSASCSHFTFRIHILCIRERATCWGHAFCLKVLYAKCLGDTRAQLYVFVVTWTFCAFVMCLARWAISAGSDVWWLYTQSWLGSWHVIVKLQPWRVSFSSC